MKKTRRKQPVHHTKKQRSPAGTIIYLFFLLLILLATVAVVQQSQELRQFAQTATPTPMMRCNVVCTYNSQCPTGLFCSNGYCRNPMCQSAEDCTCIITPTIDPYAPTSTPRPIVPTNTPVPLYHSPTPSPQPSPTYAYVYPTASVAGEDGNGVSPTPKPVFEITKEEPKNISLLEAIIQFIGTIFCKIFRSC